MLPTRDKALSILQKKISCHEITKVNSCKNAPCTSCDMFVDEGSDEYIEVLKVAKLVLLDVIVGGAR